MKSNHGPVRKEHDENDPMGEIGFGDASDYACELATAASTAFHCSAFSVS